MSLYYAPCERCGRNAMSHEEAERRREAWGGFGSEIICPECERAEEERILRRDREQEELIQKNYLGWPDHVLADMLRDNPPDQLQDLDRDARATGPDWVQAERAREDDLGGRERLGGA